MKEECGVFGIVGAKNAAKIAYLGLYALQHRGQESAGIVSEESNRFYIVKDMGLVADVFDEKKTSYLKGDSAIGHVRYSTTGSPSVVNIQPLYAKTSKGKIAIAHNGNLTNAYPIYKKLKDDGALFHSTVDSEIILHLIARSKKTDIIDVLQETLSQIEGAYALLFLGENYLIAARDPHGFKPLVLGKLGDAYIVSSETCALDLIGAKYIREIEPGELILIKRDKEPVSYQMAKKSKPAFCIFEHIYFARPDSIIFGESVHQTRKKLGAQLAKEHPIDADIVIAIPDSGNSAALGYAEYSQIPYEIGMTRNHYIGRTFIEPDQKIRNLNVKIKLNPIADTLKDKRVIVIDDSIVRGTTSRERVNAIRKAGAKEVHFRVSSPPIRCPCFFGIDTPKREKLIAAQMSIDQIRKFINADSLGYLSIEGMLSVINAYPKENYCTGCFNGKYPVKVNRKGKNAMESKGIKLYAQKK